MNIVWDARALSGVRTGIGWYTFHLIQGFYSLQEPWNGTLLTNKNAPEVSGDHITTKVLPFPNTVHLRFVWEKILLPATLRKLDFDVWHSPLTVIPPGIGSKPTVATVHDIAFLLFPEIQPSAYRRYWTHWTETACKSATKIIAVSESTRRDLINRFAVPSGKVAVVHEAADPFMFEPAPDEEWDAFRNEYGLPEEFLFFVGTLEPRKNLSLLLDVYELASDRKKNLPPLIVAGGKGWLQEGIENRMNRLGDSVRWLGYLDRSELRVCYQRSLLVLVPSLYEGFGLQAMEAMASGGVVLAADLSSLPEIVGDGGVLLPVHQGPEVWLEEILELLENPYRRSLLSTKGRERASTFSWERAARETYQVFRDSLG